jgi:ribosomal protein L16 Arg81 hydroxylase
MTQNRSKLIELFIGNIANAVLHKILERAIEDEGLSNYYGREELTSRSIAVAYRDKINPKDSPLPEKDISYIGERVKRKVYAEL